MTPCNHECTANCRRVGCNCNCGEFHVSGTIDEMTVGELEVREDIANEREVENQQSYE